MENDSVVSSTLDAQNAGKVVLYTGNLISSLEETLSATAHTSRVFDPVRGVLEIPDPFNLVYKLSDEREDYEITAKLFYLSSLEGPLKPPKSYISQSLYYLYRLLGIDSVDSFIVHFHGLLFDTQEENESKFINDFGGLVEVWKEIETLQHNNIIKKSGVSEFTKNMLEKLIKTAEIPPKINQINVKPCELPKDISNFAKEYEIELLFHRDPADILPSSTFQEVLSDLKTSLKDDLLPRWVLKYSVLIKHRGVVDNKGYIVMASAPNSDHNVIYSL